MQYYWVTFQNGTAEKAMKKFISDLVLDGSSSDVRKAVYQGLTILLKCQESHSLLEKLLPLLKDFIHDENQSVRQAFIFMLHKIKEVDCKIKYHRIVNMENFAARLAVSREYSTLILCWKEAGNLERSRLLEKIARLRFCRAAVQCN